MEMGEQGLEMSTTTWVNLKLLFLFLFLEDEESFFFGNGGVVKKY